MDSCYELLDLAASNMVEDDDREEDAIEALARIVGEYGGRAIATFALAHVQGSQWRLVVE